MEAIYNLKNGKRIAAYMWQEFLEGKFYRGETTVREIDKNSFRVIGDSKTVKVKEDENGGFFIWDGEKIYLKDFYADEVDVMAARIQECVEKKDRWLVSEDEILATFLKHSEDVVLLCDMPIYDTYFSQWGIATVGDKSSTMACVLDERDYKKSEWGYKITVTPHDFVDKAFAPSEKYYFSDFCSMLVSGRCTLVRRVDYLSYLMQGAIRYSPVEKKSVIQYIKSLFMVS